MANGGGSVTLVSLLGVGLLALVGAVVLFTLGWRWLWIVPAIVAAFWLFMFVVTLFEDRWRVVTPEQEGLGVPRRCTQCGDEPLLAIVARTRFKTSCPMCGRRESGRLRAA